jgi:formylglycine-generating enzyme required for sulfatase activity
VKEGDRWQVKTKPVEVQGYHEELAPGVALTMLRIRAGSFVMGSPAGEEGRDGGESPQHEVKLKEFFLAQTPITQAQWQVVAGWEKVELDLNTDPANFKGSNRPVEQVNWHEAVEFCRRLSQRTGRRYGLPSEAQWEYACRAGTSTPFHCGESLTSELANYDATFTYANGPKGEFRQQTTPVGSFPANPWGLQDMHGNVFEWCEDYWHENYQGAPKDGRPWSEPQANAWLRKDSRRLRGGSWGYSPRGCRSAYRLGYLPGDRVFSVGFRVCCLPPGSSS